MVYHYFYGVILVSNFICFYENLNNFTNPSAIIVEKTMHVVELITNYLKSIFFEFCAF